ncbi:putative dna rna helicase [Diaporthe ampelina]|uniref:Putative dna rna helicase n=1 Tax=Diaporthe ampelina TaxID=1214573 RepID=A0A0G2F6W5_9PEZI|nr:putative dna rna helicase [Diaporthe ampelina]
MVQAAALNPSMYQLCLVHNNAPVRFTRPLQPLVKTLSRGARPGLRSFSPASYIFITTLNSPRLWNAFSEAGLNAGLLVVDEAHQVLRTSLTFRMAAEFSGNGADVWFVTATPFSRVTLADWIPPMKLVAPRRATAMEALVTALDTAKSSGEVGDAQVFRDQFKAVFDEKLVVRYFGTSTFFGKSISDVQDVEPRIISRETPAQHKIAVQELANQIAYKDRRLGVVAQRGLLYLVSLFPAAAQLILDDPITFDMDVIRDFVRQVKNRLRVEESEPLKRLADQIVKDSPKLDYILDELERMGLDKREREPVENRSSSKFGAGEDLQMKKMVIITPTAVSAVFLYLALIRHRKDVALIHNWVSSQEKEQVVNNFTSLSAAKLVKHNRVLIAPFAVAGTGPRGQDRARGSCDPDDRKRPI